jgi:hypothetical protein
MARRSNAGEDAEWRKRFERFRRSGLTVARFCEGERVSVPSFYYWRKKLGQTASRRRTRSRPGVFRQVAVVPEPLSMAPAAPAVAWETPAVVPAPPAVIPATGAVAPASSAGVPASSRIVIQLPCGTRIEVDAEPLDAAWAVVGEVGRAHGGLQAGIRSC